MEDYIKRVRSKVGHDELILNYAGCIIFDEQNRLLLQRRTDCGKWGFPGGLLELGESAAEAAVREVREESGLDVRITALFGIYSKYHVVYANGDRAQTILHMFRAEVTGGALLSGSSETMELRYFEPEQLPPLFCRQHQDILDDLLDGKAAVYR